MPQVRIIAKNFMDMVASLPAMKLDSLYQNAYICEAILRSLPPLAKKYVVQILFFDGPVSGKLLEQWVLDDGVTKHRVAIDRKRESSYKLNQTFQANLQKHLTNGGVLPRETMAATVKLPSSEDLDTYALEQWECFLLLLISSGQAEKPTSLSSSMMKIFQRGLLSQRDRDAPRLTEGGFQFLLMDTNAQLWYIIREYISNSEERGTDPADLISFLLELSFHVTGEAYNINTLTEIQRNTIKDLAELGLVKLQQGRKESWFIPTKLRHESLSELNRFIITETETNFRLYAYSTSKLHCEILRLFSKIEYQLPNLIVGAITKESLYSAFENGITSDQIISFLQQNAHPRVAERLPSIRLWEADLNRVEITPAHLYDEFPSKDTFEAACDYAREWNGLLWEDSKKMRVVVKAEIHMNMRRISSWSKVYIHFSQHWGNLMPNNMPRPYFCRLLKCLGESKHIIHDQAEILKSNHYLEIIFVLLLLETLIAADILLNSDWEKDLPEDPTGRLHDFREFVESNFDFFKWIGMFIILSQGFSMLLAMALGALGPNNESNYDIDEEHPPARLPLINHHLQQPPCVVGEPRFAGKSDAWNEKDGRGAIHPETRATAIARCTHRLSYV
uniref:RNA polymerase II transcription factor B subunit 2 n=1 Tax=Salix viminalis TaxID=40686 RepID=A0A6N2KZH3_SALVM